MRIVLILIILALSSRSDAQVQLKNMSLTNPDLDILYTGVDNWLELTGIYELPNIDVASSGEYQITRSDNVNRFNIKVRETGPDTINISYNGKLLLTKVFHIKRINDPFIQLGTITAPTASLNQILNNKTVRIIIPDCYYKYTAQIISFQLGLLVKGTYIYREFSSGNGCELTQQHLDQIAKLHPGDQIFITDIKVAFNDGSVRTMGLLKIMIQ